MPDSPTLDLLERLAAASDPVTFEMLRAELGVPDTALRGRLRALVERGWVATDHAGAYAIGVGGLRLGSAYLDTDRVVRLAQPKLLWLNNHLDETVNLTRLDTVTGGDGRPHAVIVCLASQDSPHHRTGSAVTRRFPAHTSASGKAILATRPWAEVETLLGDDLEARTIDSVTDRPTLAAELAEIRRRGYAHERGQTVSGLGCLAVPIPWCDPVTDALSCTMPLARLTDEHAEQVAAALIDCARRIAAALRDR